MITVENNRTMFGKRQKEAPLKAIVNGQTIATGRTRAETIGNAIASLCETAKYASNYYRRVAVAADGSVFVGQRTNNDTYSIVRHLGENELGILHAHGGSMGSIPAKLTFDQYFAKIVADYNHACYPDRFPPVEW